MLRSFALTLVSLSTILLIVVPVDAGDLGNINEAVKEESSGSDDSHSGRQKKRRRHRDHDCDDDSSFFADLLGPPILFTVSSPWWLPAAAVGDDYSQTAAFSSYPYADDHSGYLLFDFEEAVQQEGAGFRLSTEYADDFSGLQRIGNRLQLDSQSRFGLDTEWNYWREEIATGYDEIWTGDANLVFRFAQSETAQFYTGLGMNWLGGSESDVGFNFTYGFDWFPAKPWVIRSVLDAGTLGSADLYHNKTTVGLCYQHVELYTGYDILHIGDTNLQGFVAGFTLWW